MNYQLFAKEPLTGDFIQLDTREVDPIAINFSSSDLEDPGAIVASYSNEFVIQHTPTNGKFFNSAYSVNGNNFDVSKKIDSFIMSEGAVFSAGCLVLNSVNINLYDGTYEYNVQYYGQVTSLSGSIADKYLSDLTSLGGLNHDVNTTNVQLSWQVPIGGANPVQNGQIRYPLVEWGYVYDNVPRPTFPTVSVGALMSFTASNHALDPTQLKPAIQVKTLIDAIFFEAGFTYESTFLNSDWFKNLYVLSDSQARMSVSNDTNMQVTSSNHLTPDNAGGTGGIHGVRINWDNIGNQLNSALFNLDYDYYTVPQGGTVSGNLYLDLVAQCRQVRPTNSGEVTYGTITLKIYDFDTNNVLWTDSTNIATTYNYSGHDSEGYLTFWDYGNLVNGAFTRTFSIPNTITGQKLAASCSFVGLQNNVPNGGNWAAEVAQHWPRTSQGSFPVRIRSAQWTIIAPTTSVPLNQIPFQTKQIDFLRDVAKRFKLVFTPSLEKDNCFNIEPWVDWLKGGTARDWTDKLDTSKEFVIKPLFSTQTREIEYADQEDQDYVNDAFQKSTQFVFGRKKIDSGIEVMGSDSKKIDSIFAPTPLMFVGNSNNWLIPHLSKLTPGSDTSGSQGVAKFEPMSPKMRLLFWNGMQASPVSWYMAGASSSFGVYPLMSTFDEWPVTTTAFDLNWYSSTPAYEGMSGATAINTQTPNTAYTKYWRDWYNLYYDSFTKIVECYFRLDSKDLLNFQFNDKVFVRDSWWFVNSIEGYVVGQPNVCKATLIQAPIGTYANPNSNETSTCPVPSGMMFSSLTGGETSIDVNWTTVPTPMYWNIEWKKTTDSTYNGLTGVTAGDLPLTLTPWSTDDAWDWRLMAVCATESSSNWYSGVWTQPVVVNEITWNFDMASTSGSLQIQKNGSTIVYETSSNGGTFSIAPGDLINIYATANSIGTPLIAELSTSVNDNGSVIYNNVVQGSPSTNDSFSYNCSGPGSITVTTYEY